MKAKPDSQLILSACGIIILKSYSTTFVSISKHQELVQGFSPSPGHLSGTTLWTEPKLHSSDIVHHLETLLLHIPIYQNVRVVLIPSKCQADL